jgi:hypothetical protein
MASPAAATQKARVDINAREPEATGNPMDDPELKAQVEAAKGVAFHLLKGIKQIQMYRHAEAKFPEFLGKTLDAMADFHKKYGPLNLKVDMTNLTLHKQDLFSDDNPLSYKFFKDGIRTLVFHPGMTIEELVQFVLISLSDPDRGAEDLNAQLWKAQIKHFEYIMVEGFRMDEFSEEEIQVEVDKIVEFLQQRLRSNSNDYLRFARVTEQDLEMQLNNIEQMRGVVISGVTATPDFKAKLQREVHEEEYSRLFPKLISAVFQVVESGVDDPELLEEMFLQLLDAMLLQEDFTTISQLVLKLRAMEQRQGKDSAMGKLLATFVQRMGEEQRLLRIGEVLRNTRPKQPQDIVRYLAEVDTAAVPVLLDVLETIELPENRQLLTEVLVPFAKKQPEPFVERLQSDRPQTVRDMIHVLDRSNHPMRLKFFGTVMGTKNLAMKLEVIGIIARGRSAEARKMIADCLDDPNPNVRMTAARVLPEFDREKAFLDLQRIVKDEKFTKKSAEEQEAMFVALGSTNSPGALAYFQDLLHKKASLFTKSKVLEEKLHAIHGLVGACTIQTYKLLEELSNDTSQPHEVNQAAKIGVIKTRKVLFGDKEVPH